MSSPACELSFLWGRDAVKATIRALQSATAQGRAQPRWLSRKSCFTLCQGRRGTNPHTPRAPSPRHGPPHTPPSTRHKCFLTHLEACEWKEVPQQLLPCLAPPCTNRLCLLLTPAGPSASHCGGTWSPRLSPFSCFQALWKACLTQELLQML